MKKELIQISAAMALLMLTGCATSFQANQLDPVSAFPSVKYKKTIFVDLAYSGRFNGESWPETDEQNQAYLKGRCSQILNDSDLFTVVSDKKGADLTLSVAVINDREVDSSKQLRSALTLYLIPYTTSDSFRSLAMLRQTSTGKDYKFSFKDGVIHKQALWLAPLAPFKSTGRGIEQCTDRIFENLCLEIHDTGLLK
ncbi:hypothetical protein P4B35_10425 [Pontiellaceae bacterium B12227]|nr:hypothetical protein [Pontiellaceae bacterium B12227]